MTERQKSITKLKDAVKNKTLACYNPKVETCMYWHGATQTCCAVGVLVPVLQMVKHIKESGNCIKFNNDSLGARVEHQIGDNTSMFGLSRDELKMLQKLHDRIVGIKRFQHDKQEKLKYLKEFEEYVNSLK